MTIGYLVPGFSSHDDDWCIPALLSHVAQAAESHTVHVFALRWPSYVRTYAVREAAVHALGGVGEAAASTASPTLPRLSAARRSRAPGLWLRALRAIRQQHARTPFDVLHAFWADEPGFVAVLAGKLLRIPVVVSIAGGELVSLPDIGYGIQRLPGRRSLVRWVLSHAQAISAGSSALIDLARETMGSRIADSLTLAPLGIDTSRFAPTSGDESPRPPVILNVGSLYPVKQQSLALRVLASVPEVQMVIAGEGPLRSDLLSLGDELGVTDRLTLAGHVAHDAMPALYRASTLLLQTSRHESQGMAVLEAAACGVPVVGTPVGVLPDLGPTGSTVEALANIINGLVADSARRKQLASTTCARVHADYSLSAAGTRFQTVYSRLVPSRARKTAGLEAGRPVHERRP